MNFQENYDVVVIGGGHAGVEASLAAARMGSKTLLMTINLNMVAFMPCNPSIGGSAKGIVVREIDALGGEMGRNIDKTYIQMKMLNTGKGPAVRALRAQADKDEYAASMKNTVSDQENLTLRQGMVEELILDEEKKTISEKHDARSKNAGWGALSEQKNVSYRYPLEEKQVVRNFTYCFEQGKVYGLIGENESGKTTLCNIIRGFIPELYRGKLEGEILLLGQKENPYVWMKNAKTFIPAFLPLPPEGAHLWDNLRLFAQFIFWGVWWPGVMIATLTLGQMLPVTKLASLAYGASPYVTNVSNITINGLTADLSASVKQVIRAGTVVVS